MSINTAEIPQIDGDLDAVDGAGSSLESAGRGFADTGSDVHATWQGLSAVYEAPEAGELLAATAPVWSDSATIGTDVRAVGSALSAYATEVRPIKGELERLRTEAMAFNSSIEGDDEWTKDEGLVNQKNGILKAVNAAVAAWQAAERTRASAINATFGGVQYRTDDGDGTHSPEEHGYSAELLDGATAGDQGVPWGRASEVDKPWYEDAVDAVGSFGKGLVVDGLWGAVRGLGTMVGVDGWDAAGQAWIGVGKLAMSLNPVALAIDQTVGMPGMEKGELGATQLAAGKALIAYDMWGQDPARASGAVVGNVIGAVVGTKGAGAAINGSGTVAKAGAVATRTFPKTSELAASLGTKVGDLKLNMTSSLNSKMAALGARLPTFGPQPAFAGVGGRGANMLEMTPGTRNGAASASLAARIDDAPTGSNRGVGAADDTLDGHGAPNKPTSGTPLPHDPGTDGSDPVTGHDGQDSVTDPDSHDDVTDGDSQGQSLDTGETTGAEVVSGSGRQPFSPYAGYQFENLACGQVGEDLSLAQFAVDGRTVVGRQVRLYQSEVSELFARGDHLVRSPEVEGPDSAHLVESKTGNAALTDHQKVVYPKLEGGGARIGSTTTDAELVKGKVLQPGDIKSAYIERWNIDDLPQSTRDSFRIPGRVHDILSGKFGRAAQQELYDWMSKKGSRVIEPIRPDAPTDPAPGKDLP